MTLEEALRLPDAELLRTGQAVKLIIRAYRDLTGCEPCFCDSQLRNYLRVVRLKMKKR